MPHDFMPGLAGVPAATSSISDVDGGRGILEYRGIRIRNHHRPLSTYLRALLDAGLRLAYFDEPSPIDETPPSRAASYRRAPWFLVMEWIKPA